MTVAFRPFAAALLFAAAFAGTASAQSPALARVDANTLREVAPVLDAAARDSLPVAALESKVLEGVAKGVRPEQIGSAVRDLAEELRGARLMLREGLGGRPIADGEVVAVAMARRQGVGADVLRSLSAASSGGVSLEIPMTVLGELVRRGVPVAEAASAMSQVVAAGVSMQVAAQIPGRVDGGLSSGAPPGRALAEALRTLNIPNTSGGRGNGPPGGSGPPGNSGSGNNGNPNPGNPNPGNPNPGNPNPGNPNPGNPNPGNPNPGNPNPGNPNPGNPNPGNPNPPGTPGDLGPSTRRGGR